ncbi:hypothetical protein [Marinobacter sp. S6332]|uniref:hypothetical protein n=1 Tax=Marinobacter sp. S6332 TaxID=2926403 RepID=UPI001FF29805|nr:hypothetical protein [Marinobacter sp. S6332]MCK0162898.1 hypothetical protein [Marinobacter sp. S6332]
MGSISIEVAASKGWVINQTLSEYIDRQQLEQERWKQTLEAMEPVAQGKIVDVIDDLKYLGKFIEVCHPSATAKIAGEQNLSAKRYI